MPRVRRLLVVLLVLLLAVPMVMAPASADGKTSITVDSCPYTYIEVEVADGEELSLNGLGYKPTVEDGVAQVFTSDLTIAKYLSENPEALDKLDVELSDLYLFEGKLYYAGDDLDEEAAADMEGELANVVQKALLSTKIAIGDDFSLGIGGLYIDKITSFFPGESGLGEDEVPASPAPTGSTATDSTTPPPYTT